MIKKVVRYCTFLLPLFGLSAFAGAYDRPSPRIQGHFDAYVHCRELRSPDGLAVHPSSGEIYVSEETEGRISVIRNNERITVVQTEFEVIGEIPNWALSRSRPESFWREQKIHSPEGIAFTKEGHLLVTEDRPNGRLFEFIPDEQGRYLTAKIIAIPWQANQHSWEGVTVATDGRIFLAGSTENSGPGLFFGTVLMRETSGNWWVVDYGPFNNFSSVALSRDEDILVVGDSVSGSINWWDAVRHTDIGVATAVVAQIEGLCVLPDGAILAAQETGGALEFNAFHGTSQKLNDGGKLVYMNPETGESFIVADGFGTIESVVVDESTGYVYVTEDSTGILFELRPKKAWDTSNYSLMRTIQTYERAEGLAPKVWPPFLKQFFGKMGVSTHNEISKTSSDKDKSFTLKEFAERVPLIAGRFQTETNQDATDPDPVVEVDFVSFFPGHTVNSPSFATPSLSLFAARHQSGKLERSKVIGDMKMFTRKNGGKSWEATGQQAYMMLPVISCAAVQSKRGIDINMAFLGMGSTPDYFLQIPGGQAESGVFYTDEGQSAQSHYDASFVEKLADGGQINNLVVAGFEAQRTERLSWYNIGNRPVSTLMSMDPQTRWMPRAFRTGERALLALFNQRQGDYLLADDAPDRERPQQQAKFIDESYVPTASLEHIRGSLEVDVTEAPGEESGDQQAQKSNPEVMESAAAESDETLPNDETAALSQNAEYWEVALYSRAVEAWTAE